MYDMYDIELVYPEHPTKGKRQKNEDTFDDRLIEIPPPPINRGVI